MDMKDFIELREDFWKFTEVSGEKGELFEKHYAATYADGVIDSKTKRLMAMCAAIASGCDGCIMGQAIRAIDLGATKDEILESCSVAFSIGGTMAGTKVALVMKLLRERNLI